MLATTATTTATKEEEEVIIKAVFKITLQEEEEGEVTYLRGLASRLNTLTSTLANFFPSPTSSLPSSSSSSSSLSGMSGVTTVTPLPRVTSTAAVDDPLIPCDICNGLVPFSIYEDHQANCNGQPPTSLPPSSLPSSTINTSNNTSATSATAYQLQATLQSLLGGQQQRSSSPTATVNPGNVNTGQVGRTILDLSLLSSALQERLLMEQNIKSAATYLLSCYNNCNQMPSKIPSNDTRKHQIIASAKQTILKTAKDTFIAEQMKQSQSHQYASQHRSSGMIDIIESLPEGFLTQFIAQCNENEIATIFSAVFLELGFLMKQSSRKNLLEGEYMQYLKKLHILVQDPTLLKLLSALLVNETVSAKSWTAREMENSSVLAPFLAPTAILSPYDKGAFNYFKSLIPNYPNCPRRDVQLLQDNLRQALKHPIECVHTILKKIFLSKEYKESAHGWIATILQLNDAKVTLNPTDPLFLEMSLMLSSDSFLLNVTELLLEFCKPFLDPKTQKISLINKDFCRSHRFDFSKTPKLADTVSSVSSPPESPSGFNFISEMFYATFYAIHVGVMPVIDRYVNYLTVYSQAKSSIDLLKQKFGEGWVHQPGSDKLQNTMNGIFSLIDGLETQFMKPELLETIAKFCQTAIMFMISLDIPKRGQEPSLDTRSLFGSFPEFFVRDVSDFFVFLLRYRSDILTTLPSLLPNLIDWVVLFLNAPLLVKSPIVRAKLSSTLGELVYKKQTEQSSSHSGMWNIQIGQQFSYAFEASKIAQMNLAPGVMLIYCDVDIVEGLDVDKEKFDKYNVRRSISILLNDLWGLPTFQQSVRNEAKTPLFFNFIGTVVNDSIHLLQDSLGRLMDIKQLQLAMADSSSWNTQDAEIKKERERYYEIQESSAKGFLGLALSILDLLYKLAKETELVLAFLSPQMINRVAAMLIHFFDSLCGPKCINLKVHNPEKYNFSPKSLLQKITLITSCFTQDDNFAEAMAKDPDYNGDIMQKALYFLSRERLIPEENYKHFEQFISKVNSIFIARNKPTGATNDFPDPMEVTATPIDEKSLSEAYVEALKDAIFDTCSMQSQEGKYQHHYSTNISAPGSASSSKMTRLVKECQTLATSLPISLSSGIFVRSDEERMDVMKAIITGPEGTPYSGGCFLFDIYCPPSYPQDPCLVNLDTTGNGTVRFNPNLYNCGKVCLSLLGTWHGDNQSSKWNPSTSSIHQVLVSIQAFILVDHPYFNEPAYEAQRGTKEGDMRSFEYNENIRLATIRHAMIEQLRNPPAGFEEIIRLHFTIQKPRVILQVEQWLKESSDDYQPKMRRAVEELKTELNKL